MKNVTFRADEAVIEAARSRAREEGTTLDEKVRSWLADYARQGNRGARYDPVMARLRRRGSVDRKYTREEISVDFLDSNMFIYPFSSAGARQRAIAGRPVRDAIETARGCISHQVVQGCLNVLGSKAARPSAALSRAGASASTPRICSMVSASER